MARSSSVGGVFTPCGLSAEGGRQRRQQGRLTSGPSNL
jgi:hypothetical protein